MKKRAAHFLLVPELAYSPPNEAIISALLSLGYCVDVFAPGGDFAVDAYGSDVCAMPVDYSRKWLFNNALSPRWNKYDVFSGTSEDPMGVVGVLSALFRKSSFCLADEIRSGSYYGSAPEYWKKLCRWGMRRADFNIVNDEERIELQREYADLSEKKDILVYPGCYVEPPLPVDKKTERMRWGVPEDAFVIGHSGRLEFGTGADWVLMGVNAYPDCYAVLQPMQIEILFRYLLENFVAANRLFVENSRLGWKESWGSMSAVDVGVIVYRSQSPQFQKMGISSNKLCMFLAMGVPVIALKQKSFEFLEEYGCGILVETESQYIDALEKVKENLETMKKNALRCTDEYINAKRRHDELKGRISQLG